MEVTISEYLFLLMANTLVIRSMVNQIFLKKAVSRGNEVINFIIKFACQTYSV